MALKKLFSENVQQMQGLLLRAANNAAARGDYEKAKRLLQAASTLLDTYQLLKDLLREEDLTEAPEAPLRTRARRGEVTPIDAYRRPILEVLDELGGRAAARKVIELVFQRMQDTLKPADLVQTRGSRLPRWKQHIYGARSLLKKEGLLSSPERGIWALTRKGREALQREKVSVS